MKKKEDLAFNFLLRYLPLPYHSSVHMLQKGASGTAVSVRQLTNRDTAEEHWWITLSQKSKTIKY